MVNYRVKGISEKVKDWIENNSKNMTNGFLGLAAIGMVGSGYQIYKSSVVKYEEPYASFLSVQKDINHLKKYKNEVTDSSIYVSDKKIIFSGLEAAIEERIERLSSIEKMQEFEMCKKKEESHIMKAFGFLFLTILSGAPAEILFRYYQE